MQENYQTTKTAGNGSNVGPGYPPNASWTDPDGVTGVGAAAFLGFFEGAQPGDTLVVDQFGFDIPDFAVVDGVSVSVTGSNVSCYGTVTLSDGVTPKDVGALDQSYGGSTDLWGATAIAPSDINDTGFGISVDLTDVSGGDGTAEVSLVEITIYWHIDIDTAPAEVPTRVAYKVYSREGRYLGELPNVSSKFGFSQDINSAGSTIDIECGYDPEQLTTTSAILTDDDIPILTDDDLPILADETEIVLAFGAASHDAIFKNSNRVKVWIYNYWHPNGKLMFSGQVNKIGFSTAKSNVKLHVISDGFDMQNFIVRGYPFSYTTDVSQTSQNGYVIVSQGSGKGAAAWERYGQTWRTGASVTNVGAIDLRIRGSGSVTLSVYDGPAGNLLGSVTRTVSAPAAGSVFQFEFPQLITVSPSTEYFMAVSVAPGQNVGVFRHTTGTTYANGTMYSSSYSGGSGGGSYTPVDDDFYFVTKYGTPTTTTTYSSDDPTTEMMTNILLDYNARGGYITQRDFLATGLSETYTFNQATVFDAVRKVLEMSPTGFYAVIDLGTAEMDILQQTDIPDFTVVRGRGEVNELDVVMSTEQVKNYMLFNGGEVSPGVNLYRDYQDSESASFYGLRTVSRSDNRVTLTNTADAIGETFIAESSDEIQETSVTVLNTTMDITQLVPGKNIGFRNFGGIVDTMVLQIVRREFGTNAVTLSLGRLPVRMNDQIQRINRGLLNEQTISNPSAPS